MGSWGKDSWRPLHLRTRSLARGTGGDPSYRGGRQRKPGFWDPVPSPGHTPFERPPETTEKGPSLTPWPQEPKQNQSCAASKKHGWGGLPSVLIPEPPRPARAPLCTPPSVFLLAPCHCANTQVFFGDGTRLTVVGKTCCRSSGPLAGTAGPRGAFQSGPILMC